MKIKKVNFYVFPVFKNNNNNKYQNLILTKFFLRHIKISSLFEKTMIYHCYKIMKNNTRLTYTGLNIHR